MEIVTKKTEAKCKILKPTTNAKEINLAQSSENCTIVA